MNNELDVNNKVFIQGEIDSLPEFDHAVKEDEFYKFNLKIPRLSGQCDIIPVTIPKRMQQIVKFELGKPIAIRGQFRSYNKLENGKSKLMLTVFVREICDFEEDMKNIWENFPDKGLRDSWTDYYINMLLVQNTPKETSTIDAFKQFYKKYFDEEQIDCIFYYSQCVFEYDHYQREHLWRLEFINAFKDVGYDIMTMNSEIDACNRIVQEKTNKLREMMNDYDFNRYTGMYGKYEDGFDF